MVEGLEKLIKAIAKFGDVTIKVAEMMGLLQNVLKTWFNEAACIVVGKPLNKVYTYIFTTVNHYAVYTQVARYVSNLYGTEIKIWAGFWPVGNTEKRKFEPIKSNF